MDTFKNRHVFVKMFFILAILCSLTGYASYGYRPLPLTPKLQQRQAANHWMIDFNVLPDGSTIYAIDSEQDQLSIVDVASKGVIKLFPLKSSQQSAFGEVVFSPSGQQAYISDLGTIYIMDTSTFEVTNILSLSNNRTASALAISKDGSTLFSADLYDAINQGYISVYSINTVPPIAVKETHIASNLTNRQGFADLILSDDEKEIYLLANANNFVSTMDITTGKVTPRSITIKNGIGNFFIKDPNENRMYITVSNYVELYDLATHSLITKIRVGHDAMGLAITPDGSKLYVANRDDNTISVVNLGTNQETKVISVGDMPQAVRISKDGKNIYVGNSRAFSVTVIDTTTDTVMDTIPLDGNIK